MRFLPRFSPAVAVFWACLAAGTAPLAADAPSIPPTAPDPPLPLPNAAALESLWRQKIPRATVEPRWDARSPKHLWYVISLGKNHLEWVVVDSDTGHVRRGSTPAEAGLGLLPKRTSQTPFSDLNRSADSPRRFPLEFSNQTSGTVSLVWRDPSGNPRPYGTLAPSASRRIETFEGHLWSVLNAENQEIARIQAHPESLQWIIDGPSPRVAPAPPNPNGTARIVFENHQAVLRDSRSDSKRTLTEDGSAPMPYQGPVFWSPDGNHVVVHRVQKGTARELVLRESAPPKGGDPVVHKIPYPKPGDTLPKPTLVLFSAPEWKPVEIPSDRMPNPFTPEGRLEVRWAPDSSTFFVSYNQRGHQVYRILAVSAASGAVRTVVEETASTFIDTTQKTWRHWLDSSRELLWLSERDGWCHLWLYDLESGTPKTQITRGPWVVRKVLRVDEATRRIWFLASGIVPGEDPYQQHLCRIQMDGGGLTRLTSEDADHEISIAPEGHAFVDCWSRADLAPVTQLRRLEDGSLIVELERCDLAPLLETGWTLPERFVAKGRDGATDIHGVLVKPPRMDPQKRYPVLEEVYAGPHGAFAAKRFHLLARQHLLAELGFVVVQSDGMGTNHRGKTFHDLAWKNLRDAGFPDRIAWIRAAAASRAWMDLTRIGIYGGSAGGQNAMRALLEHSDFYRAAVADCGCHDNRMDKIWWNEQWMGWPVDDSYTRSSNVADAARLQGALMLTVGELDQNVDPASTLQVVHALIAANKDFELLVLPGTGHGAGETAYAVKRRMQFFQRHLGGPKDPIKDPP
ncbi:MAG: Prolyl tripeptidyl peptidase precursor [Verrucomicrobiota bacterium]